MPLMGCCMPLMMMAEAAEHQDNIAKWGEMSAYQMADKYCHYLCLVLSPKCLPYWYPVTSTPVIYFKSFMCEQRSPVPSSFLCDIKSPSIVQLSTLWFNRMRRSDLDHCLYLVHSGARSNHHHHQHNWNKAGRELIDVVLLVWAANFRHCCMTNGFMTIWWRFDIRFLEWILICRSAPISQH